MEEEEDVFEASAQIDTIEIECDSVNFTLGEKFYLKLRAIEGENLCI